MITISFRAAAFALCLLCAGLFLQVSGVFAACDKKAAAATEHKGAAATTDHKDAVVIKDGVMTLEKTGEGYTWTLRTPSKSGVVQVVLRLRDADGKPITGKKITGELLMPHMPMAGYPLPLDFQEDTAGEYLILAQYAHGGHWRITAGFAADGDRRVQESFDFNLTD